MKSVIDLERQRWNKAALEYSKKIEDKDAKGFLIRDKVLNPYLFLALDNVKGKKILDYGCGDGWLCEKLKKEGSEVKGCDISDKFLDIARKKYPGIEFTLIDNKTPYQDNEFDIVICNIVLHITKNYKQVLQEIYRIIKPEGKLVVTIMHPSYWKAEQSDFSKKQEAVEVKVEDSVPVIHYRRNIEIYEKAFEELGFRIIQKQECLAKKKISEELKKYSEKPFFLLWELEKWVKYSAAAAIFNDAGEVLIARRSKTKFPFPDTLSIPSTSYKKTENPKKALKKAIKNKLGVDTDILESIGKKEGKQTNCWVKMTVYRAKIVGGEIIPDQLNYSYAEFLPPIETLGDIKGEQGFCTQVLLEKLKQNKLQK